MLLLNRQIHEEAFKVLLEENVIAIDSNLIIQYEMCDRLKSFIPSVRQVSLQGAMSVYWLRRIVKVLREVPNLQWLVVHITFSRVSWISFKKVSSTVDLFRQIGAEEAVLDYNIDAWSSNGVFIPNQSKADFQAKLLEMENAMMEKYAASRQ